MPRTLVKQKVINPITATGTLSARSLQDRFSDVINVKDFGAKGDGVTDDTAAIQAAANYVGSQGGGYVYLPATGSAYRITNTIALPNGTVLCGTLGKNFAGATATNAQWAADGSWLNPEHVSNPAVRLQGHGSGIVGINFIHNQPTPSGGSWTPNVYGYCIEQTISHSTIEDILIVNASHGIYMKYTTGSGGGTQVRWRDVIISAFNVRMRTTCVNDTAYMSNIHLRNLWYSSDSNVVSYIRNNTIGWYCGYTDNIMVDGLEFFEDGKAIYFEDETCLGNTHSLYNGTLSNVHFNLPQICMQTATLSTTVAGYFVNTLCQTGNAFGYTWSNTAFQLSSDNIKLKFNGLTIRDAGGQVFSLGAGASGSLSIDNLDVDRYSGVAAGQICFGLNTGFQLRLSNYKIDKITQAGRRFAGAGLERLITDSYGCTMLFTTLNQITSVCNGSYQNLTTDIAHRPGQSFVHEVRLSGQVNVTTPQVGGTLSLDLLNMPEISAGSIDASSSGIKTFDTQWQDIPQAYLNDLRTFGPCRLKGTNNVVVTNGGIQITYR